MLDRSTDVTTRSTVNTLASQLSALGFSESEIWSAVVELVATGVVELAERSALDQPASRGLH